MVGEKKWVPYALLTPWIIGLIVFKIYPFINSFILSLFNYNLMHNQRSFTGLGNFIKIFNDEKFYNSIWVTTKYVAIAVPSILIISLFIAYILHLKLKGISFFRVAYYLPTILGANVAIAVFWKYLFGSEGLVNNILKLFGAEPLAWLGDKNGALFVIILLRVWQFGSTMIIFLAALKNVPESLYEAAEIDGASKFKKFIHITLPMITPIILFNTVMRLIETFQVFNEPMLITNEGGPLNATHMINLYIYQTAFKSFEMGYASALSLVLFLIIMVFTILVFRSSKYWVYYQD